MSAIVAAAARAFGFDGPSWRPLVILRHGAPPFYEAACTDRAGGFFLLMNLQSTDFELFGVPAQFAQDRSQLDTRWKELQRQAHPDKFAAQGTAAQRVAMQWSVRINEAYQRLKNPLRRASYLCELHGAPIQAESNTAMPTEFLMQQMAWREALDEARSLEDFERIAFQALQAGREQLLKIEQAIDADNNFTEAAQQVRSLMFIERFASEVDARIDQLGQ